MLYRHTVQYINGVNWLMFVGRRDDFLKINITKKKIVLYYNLQVLLNATIKLYVQSTYV